MANQKQFTQSKLAGFFFASETGKPITNLPVFGEVSLVVSEVPFIVDFPKTQNEMMMAAGIPVPLAKIQVQQNLLDYLSTKLPFLLSKETYDNQKSNIDTPLWKVILKLLEEVKNGDFGIDGEPEPHKSDKLIGHFKELAKQQELSIDEQTIKSKTFSYPLGFLSTDHVGYFSFDLSRVPKDYVDNFGIESKSISQINQYSFSLFPFGKEELKIDVLAENRFSPDAIVTKQSLSASQFWNLEGIRLPSIQTPNILDWYLSPGSFAQSPELLLDEDGTEKMLPSNLSLHEFNFHQLVRFSNSNAFPNPIINASIPNFIRFGGLDTYKSSWHNLGHSLGQILYSQPLAPGESIKLTVVDYTFTDDSKREEDTKFSEKLLHEQHRDRTISETVAAAVNEIQKGSSTMAGIGIGGGKSSSGGAAEVVKDVAKTAVSGGASAIGINASLGHTTSKSEGHRDTKAETVQKLMDNFSQASSAQRELKSSVVVETKQEQKETIQTRIITNYNHSHTLTILYYEVLRHFRVTTEYVRTRPVLFVKMKDFPLSERGILRKYKNVIEQNLLEEKHKAGFTALEKIIHREAMLGGLQAHNQAERKFQYFTIEMVTGGLIAKDGDSHVRIEGTLKGIKTVQLFRLSPNIFSFNETLNSPGSFQEKDRNNVFVAFPKNFEHVSWGDFSLAYFTIDPDNCDVSIKFIRITGTDIDGIAEILVERDYDVLNGHLIYRDMAGLSLPLKRPLPFGLKSAEQAEDEFNYNELITHLTLNQAYYNTILNLSQNKFELSNEFENVEFIGDKKLTDVINLEPIDVMGNYIAYPCTDDAVIKIAQNQMQKDTEDGNIVEERLMTLPTKGIFAEGKLGHANLSEEIDNTRFWKWDEHPIPFAAPDIAPATPITPSPVSNNLNPSPFPNSLVNIVNPPAAPDPTGMQQAMSLLSKGDIFRDMSGRAETGALLGKLSSDLNGLLGKLSDNSVTTAKAAEELQQIQKKYETDMATIQKDAVLGAGKLYLDFVQAETARIKAEADKANVEVAKEELKLRQEIPSSSKTNRQAFENAGVSRVTGGTNFQKSVNFSVKDIYGNIMALSFTIGIKDISTSNHKIVLEKNIKNGSWDESISFKSYRPTVNIYAAHAGTSSWVVNYDTLKFSFENVIPILKLKEASATIKSDFINITIQQQSISHSITSKNSEEASRELSEKFGGELGFDKVVAAKIIGEAQKTNINKDGKEKEIRYDMKLPSKEFKLVISGATIIKDSEPK